MGEVWGSQNVGWGWRGGGKVQVLVTLSVSQREKKLTERRNNNPVSVRGLLWVKLGFCSFWQNKNENKNFFFKRPEMDVKKENKPLT